MRMTTTGHILSLSYMGVFIFSVSTGLNFSIWLLRRSSYMMHFFVACLFQNVIIFHISFCSHSCRIQWDPKSCSNFIVIQHESAWVDTISKCSTPFPTSLFKCSYRDNRFCKEFWIIYSNVVKPIFIIKNKFLNVKCQCNPLLEKLPRHPD